MGGRDNAVTNESDSLINMMVRKRMGRDKER